MDTPSFAAPVCRKSASVSVVLPWSTWAIIAIFLISIIKNKTPCEAFSSYTKNQRESKFFNNYPFWFLARHFAGALGFEPRTTLLESVMMPFHHAPVFFPLSKISNARSGKGAKARKRLSRRESISRQAFPEEYYTAKALKAKPHTRQARGGCGPGRIYNLPPLKINCPRKPFRQRRIRLGRRIPES